MNIKKLLIERERVAYIRGDTEQANFLDAVLEHVIALEEQINVLQRETDETEAKKDA